MFATTARSYRLSGILITAVARHRGYPLSDGHSVLPPLILGSLPSWDPPPLLNIQFFLARECLALAARLEIDPGPAIVSRCVSCNGRG
ncbi:hypothetical protein BaRGS_00019646 [Batillaria attramentaria]|uniref:Uncharacterized protein n=1 Tax=Batillaria attramentaria TaxID=370345 RepID=A0ABD0KQH9_9CAEN